MNSLKRLYNVVKGKLTTQVSYETQAIIEPLTSTHEPTYANYSPVLKALNLAIQYMRSESFLEKGELFAEMIGTEYLRPFEERQMFGYGTEVFSRSYQLLAVHSNEEFFDYINNSLIRTLDCQPTNVDAPELLQIAVETKLNSNSASAYSRITIPLTISTDILLRLITYSPVSQRVRILLLNNVFLFDKSAVLVQLHAIFKSQIAALIEPQNCVEDVFEAIEESLCLYCAYENDEAAMGGNILLYLIQPIAKLIRQICFESPQCEEFEFAANLMNLSAEIIRFVREEQKLTVFATICKEVMPQRVEGATDASALTPFEQVLLEVLQCQLQETEEIEYQLAMRNAAFSVIIQIISGAHNRAGQLCEYRDCLIGEAMTGIVVKEPCKTFRLAADQLSSRQLQRIAQISASIPVEHMIQEGSHPNMVVYYAIQAFIGVFDVLQYNDYCGDDCAYTRDDTGKSYQFEVSGAAITQLVYLFTNYRLFSSHLLLVNPHFKDELDHVDELVQLALAKMTPHVAMLKANSAGFFEKVDFVQAFDRMMRITDDMQAERAAIFTGFLLGRIKSGDPRWIDFAGQREDSQFVSEIAENRGVIQDEEEAETIQIVLTEDVVQ